MDIRAPEATSVQRRSSAVATMMSAVVALPMMMSASAAGVLADSGDQERGQSPGRTQGTILSLSNVDRGFVPGRAG